MAYYSHNHNLAYDFTLFEEPYDNRNTARLRKNKSEDAAVSEGGAGSNQSITRTTIKKRNKTSRRKRNIGRIAFGVILGIAVMAMIASIIHGQVQLTELNQEIITAEHTLANTESIYIQNQMKVESTLSNAEIEKYATEVLGMTKASNAQKEFVALESGDKAEVSAHQDSNIFTQFFESLSNLWS